MRTYLAKYFEKHNYILGFYPVKFIKIIIILLFLDVTVFQYKSLPLYGLLPVSCVFWPI